MPVLDRPLKNTKFTLDASGVAGFFGGEEAISAMATVHLFKGRKLLGWYNSPGSYTIAKRFGQLAASRFWDGLFPGPNETPAISFGLDGRLGPKYFATLSGTSMQTGHLGYLTMQKAKDERDLIQIEGRTTAPSNVAFLDLKDVKYHGKVPQRDVGNALLGFIPIQTSFLACIMCALVADWFAFAMILLGIISSGVACLVIGSGELSLDTVKTPAPGAPPGDGMLIGDNIVIVVKGAEKDVNAITKGKFLLKIDGAPTYNGVGLCSLLLLVQFLLQLLLIPQGTLFGQIMFLASLGVSWVYNSYLSSLEKEKIQAEVLFEKLGKPDMRTFRLGTRTTMAVFACLLLCDGMESSSGNVNPGKILLDFIPNDTQVWQRWRKKVIQQMKERSSSDSLTCLELNQDDRSHLEKSDLDLLTTLVEDARSAFKGYHRYLCHPNQKSLAPMIQYSNIDTLPS
ncbi:hypothetical protein J3R82DRAFT_4775 [Butyriboletus roseoflavus]|nr:hypothetical protein J3R82DRAFT_4775 [Butyriboletus roseoflavus]